MNDFNSLTDIISKDEGLANLRKFMMSADVVERFNELFPDLNKIVKAKKLDKQTLYLSVENSVWRSELKFREKMIIDRINTTFGSELVKHIKFTAK